MNKIVEAKNKYFNVSILDSTFVNNENDDFSSCYSVVQGIVLIFQVELLSSSSDFIQEINKFYKNAQNSVEGELNIIIGLKVSENNQIDDLFQRLFDKIEQIVTRFKCEVFLFCIENGENVEEMFYSLIKKIAQNKKEKDSLLKKKDHKNKKIKAHKRVKK